ncbi:MAG: winged helix-turn-helix domain-containing protein [Thaumarchaeota archaeon]|nr:winged helix-turn-helix domain-containing protein [Nitrososphaerota archaeon]
MEKSRRKRNSYELLAEMLISSRGGARKTTIMFRANLSFQLLTKYLTILLTNGFLEFEDGFFRPSPKGLSFLRRFAKYQRAKNDVRKSEELVRSYLSFTPTPGRPA